MGKREKKNRNQDDKSTKAIILITVIIQLATALVDLISTLIE